MLYRHIFAAATALLLSVPLLARERGNDSFVEGYVVHGDHAYFIATREWSAPNLWRTDGTAAGTTQVTQYAGADAVQTIVAFREQLFYFVKRGASVQLAATDGTRGGSYDIGEVGASADVSVTAVHRDALYFAAGNTLWKSDGTADGTRAIRTLDGSAVRAIAPARDQVFVATHSSLWVTDGTAEGTRLLEYTTYADPVLAIVDDVLIFRKSNRQSSQIWRSDGTAAGTYRIADGWTDPDRAAVLDGRAYIAINQARTILRTDGTIDGTIAIPLQAAPIHVRATADRIIALGSNWAWTCNSAGEAEAFFHSLTPENLWSHAAGDTVYFGSGGWIWKTDGTRAGTERVETEMSLTSAPESFTTFGVHVLFAATSELEGREPWTSRRFPGEIALRDATTTGTAILPANMIANLHKEGAIEGRLLGSDGTPLRSGNVALRNSAGHVAWALIDTEGLFQFRGLRSGAYRVEGSSFGRAPRTSEREIDVLPGRTSDGIELRLPRGAQMYGRVTGADGEPVANVWVCAGPRYGVCAVSGRSGADGTYETSPEIEPGKLQVVYTAENDVYSGVLYDRISCANGCDERSRGLSFSLAEGEEARADFVVRPKRLIRGRVLDALTGKEIGDPITVKLGDQTRDVSNAFFQFYVRDGRWPLTASTTLYLTGSYRELVGGALPEGSDVSYDILLTPKFGRVRGRVIDAATGAPAAGVVVRIVRTAYSYALLTRSDGTYGTHPELTPATYKVSVGEEMEPISFTIDRNEIITIPDIAVTIPARP